MLWGVVESLGGVTKRVGLVRGGSFVGFSERILAWVRAILERVREEKGVFWAAKTRSKIEQPGKRSRKSKLLKKLVKAVKFHIVTNYYNFFYIFNISTNILYN